MILQINRKGMNVGGVKQAANIFVPVFFFTYEIGHDNENKTKF